MNPRKTLIAMVIIFLLGTLAMYSCGGNGGEDGEETSNPLFVAVGGEDILISSDGDSWEAATNVPAGVSFLQDVAGDGNGQWVAVGSAGSVIRSDDGITWVDASDTATDQGLEAVHYGDGLWIAGGEGIIFSNDSDVWTTATPVPDAGNISGIGYGEGLWVAVTDGSGSEYVINSTDGATWAVATTITSVNEYLYDVAFGNDLWVSTGAGNEIFNSLDGDTWNPTNSVPDVTDTVDGVIYRDGLWVAVGENGTIFNSPDGDNWSEVNAGIIEIERFSAVTYGNGVWVAVGNIPYPEEAEIYISSDGENWVPASFIPLGTGGLYGVAYQE